MKDFKLTFTWDSLRQGELPEKDLLEVDPNTIIEKVKVNTFQQSITLSTTIEDNEDEMTIAFEIGQLLGTIVSNKYK